MCHLTSHEYSAANKPKRRSIWLPQWTRRQLAFSVVIFIFTASTVLGYLSRDHWLPHISHLAFAAQEHSHKQVHLHNGEDEQCTAGQPHSETNAHTIHSTQADEDATSLELSLQGQKNIGLQLATVQPRDFARTTTVPAMVKERPGQTRIKVSAPMTGIVTRIYPIYGEAVVAGQPLFDLRLTHEDLVDNQSMFLETVEQLDVIKQEVARLDAVTSSGAIAGKRLLERQYEQQQSEARLRAQQQALILHGLTEQQVHEIETNRKLLQQVTVFAPQADEAAGGRTGAPLLQVARIEVAPGEHVEAGNLLCELSDHAVLYIEGIGFEEDSGELNDAANTGSPITAVIEANGRGNHTLSDLKILHVENEVDLESRALRFYVRLPNELVRNEKTPDGHHFISWRFKPGQRVQLLIPVEQWKNQMVLPMDAVIQDGADWFVFQQNGKQFDRKPVHVEYRDLHWAVIANDGSLAPGDTVVTSGAYQMHLALKNKAGGGVDPHAGHNH